MSEEELVLCIPQSDNLSALPDYMNDHVTAQGSLPDDLDDFFRFMMIGWTRLTRTVSVWRRSTPKTEAKDQITEQTNKYARNGRRRYREPSESLFKTDSVESKVEKEMLSVKMRLAKAICRNKFGDDTAEKFVSDDATKAIAETTQLLENVVEQLSKSGQGCETLKMRNQVHQVKEELIQELCKENGKDLVDPEAPPRTAGCGRNQMYRRDLHKVGVKAACVAQEGGRTR